MQFSTSFIAAAAAFLPLVSAHCQMAYPKPYAFNTDNSPLAADGSNFPCKMPAGFTGGAEPSAETYEPGKTGTFKIQGSAIHGGGSCQISITYDNPPTKNSVFKVVQSYEGACPGVAPSATEGNYAANPGRENPAFPVTLPLGLKKGPATFVWSWFNQIGNREMYMNCAPITIGGDGTSDDVYNSLPDMFVANIGGQCSTPDNTDVIFPNPGKNVVRSDNALCKFSKPTCTGGAGSGSGQDTGAGAGGSNIAAPGGDAGDGGNYGPGSGSSQGSGSNDGSYPGGIFVGVTTTIDNGAPAATYTPINDSPSTTMQSVVARPTGSYGNGGNMGGGNMGGGSSPAPIDGGDDSSNDDSSNMGDNYGSGNVSAPAPVEGETCDGSWIVQCESDDSKQFKLCYGKNQMAKTFDCSAGTTCADMRAAHEGSYKAKFKRTAREHARRMAHRHSHRRF